MTAVLQAISAATEIDPRAIGVVDIGSNSVRLVVYEGARRSPLPLFNEKRICELGRGVARSGRLDAAAMDDTLALLRRFRLLAERMDVQTLHAVATAAVREAENGDAFIVRAGEALGFPIDVLTGQEEARFAAAGVLSGDPDADGLVGDLGGGSLELVDVEQGRAGNAETAAVGTLRLLDRFDTMSEAVQAVDSILGDLALPRVAAGRTIYAVGGTWRALARIHMDRTDHPLHIIDHLRISAEDALETAHLIRGLSSATMKAVPNVSAARVKTIPFGAMVLERLITLGRPKEIVFAAHGLREGLLFSNLPTEIAGQDPLIAAATATSQLRARSFEHCRELCDWTEALFLAPGPGESANERRLRHAACLLADIGWRAHPDYRATRCIDNIALGNLSGIDHPGRAFVALAVYSRHDQRIRQPFAKALARLLDEPTIERAKVLGSAIKLAFSLSAAMPGIIPRCPLIYGEGELVLRLPSDLVDLNGAVLERRIASLAALLGRSGRVEIVD